MIQRRKTRPIQLGKVKVGGDAPITVQSMTKTDTRDVRATVQQIWDLEAAGCEIIRCAVPVREAALQLGDIKKRIRIPLVADIHFNYKLALIAIEQGVDGLRLNPGNIGARKYVEEVVRAASERKIPIRIGVNAGSLEKICCKNTTDRPLQAWSKVACAISISSKTSAITKSRSRSKPPIR